MNLPLIAFPPILDTSSNLKFLHPVGVSTFKYGLTIPLKAQTERLRAIEKGGKVSVTVLCGNEEPVTVEIRRLNNGAEFTRI
jgi:hypothetical protein